MHLFVYRSNRIYLCPFFNEYFLSHPPQPIFSQVNPHYDHIHLIVSPISAISYVSWYSFALGWGLIDIGEFNDCQLQLQIKKQIQTFSKRMNKPRSLDELLRSHDLTADEFFQTQGVAQQIRNKLNKFVRYCKSHRAFARRMIFLALNVPYAELEDLNLKAAAHAITEVLSNEEPAIAELFFEEDTKPATETSDIPEELEGSGIQSEAQRILGFDEDSQEQAQQQRPVELEKLELAGLSLEILQDPQRNATCLGHLHKIYSFLIRHNPLPVLQYFQDRPEALQLLLVNLRYSSVSSLVAQLLTSQDKTRKYAFEGLKKQIIEYAIDEMFRRIEDEDFFDGVMILVEEILNTTKQSYYEYFEDFKRVSNLLVSKDIMKRFLDIILELNEKPFRSASKFLEFLFGRINSEREDNSYYHRGEETEPSMNFEVDVFFQQIPVLVGLVPRIESFNSLTKISYISFLEALLISAKEKGCNFSVNQPAFLALMDCLNRLEKAGIYKNKLYNLIASIITRATPQQTSQFLEANKGLWQNYFSTIKAANYSNTKTYNKNESSGYDVSLISQFGKKNQTVIPTATKVIGKDFKRMCKKYETKIASFQSSSSVFFEEQSTFEQFNFQTNNRSENNSNGNSLPTFSLNLVGKNSISIPVLNLPDRNHTTNEEEARERPNERSEVPHINGIKEIIEVEEVVSLTDTIKTLTINDREECHIQRPPELSRNQQELDSPERPPKKGVKPQVEQKEVVEVKGKSETQSKQQKSIPKNKEKTDINAEQARFFAKHLAIFA